MILTKDANGKPNSYCCSEHYNTLHAGIHRCVWKQSRRHEQSSLPRHWGFERNWNSQAERHNIQVLGYIRSLRSLSLSRHLGSPHLIPRIFRKHFEACGLQGRNAISFSTYLFCDVIAEWAKATWKLHARAVGCHFEPYLAAADPPVAFALGRPHSVVLDALIRVVCFNKAVASNRLYIQVVLGFGAGCRCCVSRFCENIFNWLERKTDMLHKGQV